MPFPSISFFFSILTLNLFFGFQVNAVPYDYSYTLGCQPKPEPPQYGGGMLVNPEFKDGANGWTAVGNAAIKTATLPDGNNYLIASNRLVETDGVSQTITMEKDKFYTVSAWIQISAEKSKVHATMVRPDGSGPSTAGWITGQSGCWKMIKGGLFVNATGPVELHFAIHDNTTLIDLWLASVSVQPFTLQEWTSHQEDSREKVRKSTVKFQAMDENGKPVPNAAVTVHQRKPNFPWGNAMNEWILTNPTYQKWFLDRFQYTVFENELKWSYVEPTKGAENYTLPDAMLQFAKSNNLTVRGHNILWSDLHFMAQWLKDLRVEDLEAEAIKRINSVVTKYKGQFIHWDVINENMHYNLFSALDAGKFDSNTFNLVHRLDPASLLFLNEFNVIEAADVAGRASPSIYLDKIADIRSGGYSGPLGIGLQSHFTMSTPNMPYIRSSLDLFASTGLPIWITELDVNVNLTSGFAPGVLDMVLRELYSHPAVQGMVMWASMNINGTCFVMCMTDLDFKNNVAGDVVDKFIGEFIKVGDTKGTTDANGVFQASLFHGEYEASIDGAPPSTFSLVPKKDAAADVTTVQLKVNSGGGATTAHEL